MDKMMKKIELISPASYAARFMEKMNEKKLILWV